MKCEKLGKGARRYGMKYPLVVRMRGPMVSAQEPGPDAFFSLGAREL